MSAETKPFIHIVDDDEPITAISRWRRELSIGAWDFLDFLSKAWLPNKPHSHPEKL
jgi:hypothetical protein